MQTNSRPQNDAYGLEEFEMLESNAGDEELQPAERKEEPRAGLKAEEPNANQYEPDY